MLTGAAPGAVSASRLDVAGPTGDGPDVWLLDVDPLDARCDDVSLLDAAERERAARFTRPADRASYLAAHVLLRRLLGERLGVPPGDVALTREPCVHCGAPHGRPALADPGAGVHFSVSRRDLLVLVGLGRTPIGVDVEAVPDDETVASVSALLHERERREILSAGPRERAQRFAGVWVRKEAYLKGVGAGVAGNLAADDVGSGPAAAGPPGWAIAGLPVPTGYAAAVAWSDPSGPERPAGPV